VQQQHGNKIHNICLQNLTFIGINNFLLPH